MLTRTLALIFSLAFVLPCPGQDEADLGLYLRFDTPPSAVFLNAIEMELADILSPATFRLHWITDLHNTQQSSFARALIVTFHGSCSAPASGEGVEPGQLLSLAHTAADAAGILPYIDIDCNRVRAFLGAAPESRFGRAIGRVLAHELYHVLLQTRRHSKTGIAKAVHSPAALLSQSLRFQDGELERMRSAFSAPAAALAKRPASEPVAAFGNRVPAPY